jgi:hypothetical protein
MVDDLLPTVSGEDGLAVLKVVEQLVPSMQREEPQLPQSPVKVEVKV